MSGIVPIYVYFHLQNAATQTADSVAASLLKQVAWPPEKDRPYLKILYDAIHISSDRPTRDTLLDLLVQCAQSVKIRVLFDALDECNDHELGKIYQIIQKLRDANIGVYVTTRSHIVGLLRTRFPDAVYMEDIQADPEDVRKVLERQIKEHREPVETEFMNEIVDKIGNSQGMYHHLKCLNLTA